MSRSDFSVIIILRPIPKQKKQRGQEEKSNFSHTDFPENPTFLLSKDVSLLFDFISRMKGEKVLDIRNCSMLLATI
jgi:hypothetical protein